MSDSLEKFVLQYTVELQDSIRRLEQLNQKIDDTNKKSKKGAQDIKGFAKEAASHLSDLVPGVDKVTGSVLKLTGGVTAATAALAAMAVIIKSVKDLSDEYEKQRITAFNVGMSPTGVETMQRQLRGANGRMTSESSRALLEKTSNMAQSAYQNPNPWNESALKLRNLGTSAYGKDGKIKSTEQMMDEITKKFQSVSESQAQAIGQSAGFTLDEIKAIRERSAAIVASTKLTDAARAKQFEATQAMEQMGESGGHISETFRQIEQTIAREFMPTLGDFVKWADDITKDLPADIEKGFEIWNRVNAEFAAGLEWLQNLGTKDNLKKMLHGEFEGMGDFIDRRMKEFDAKVAKDSANQKKQDETAKQSYQASNQFAKNVALFASSVSTFSGAIDSNQVLAAWAGAAGAAGGLRGIGAGPAAQAANSGGGSGTAPGGYTPIPAGVGKKDWKPSQWDAQIEAVWGPYAEIGKAIMRTESGGNPNAKNKNSSASGLFQVLKGSWKAGENPFDGQTSIQQGYRVFMEKMRATHGDVHKSIKYYGENTEEYYNKVMGHMKPVGDATGGFSANSGMHADSRATVQQDEIMSAVAQRLGVSMEQLKNKGVAKSDVNFVVKNMQFEAKQALEAAQAQSQVPGMLPQQQRAASDKLRQAQMNFENLKTYGSSVIARGQGSENDPLQRMAGVPDKTGTYTININAYGVQDVNAFKKDVAPVAKEIVNDRANGVKA